MIDVDNPCSRKGKVHMQAIAVRHVIMKRSSTKPPHNDEEPEDNDEEDYVPQPPATLPLGHVIHATKRAREDARRLREGIVLSGCSSRERVHETRPMLYVPSG